MELEYVNSDRLNSPKIRLMRDKNGKLFVRKNVKMPAELSEKLMKISSPYIVKFAEFGEDEDGFFSVEEFVGGVPATEKTFTKKQALRAVMQLCEALQTLHSMNIIHRDIKPSNIIITSGGDICLIDFDAARVEKIIGDKDTQILGTEGFAPPEQFGFSQTDKRSDIYSFGVTMKVLLGENCPGFENIIRKCTSFDPKFRYSNMRQVMSAIRFARFRKAAFLPLFAAGAAGFAIAVSAAAAFLERDVPAVRQYSESSFSSVSVSSEISSSAKVSSSVYTSSQSPAISESSTSSQSSETSSSGVSIKPESSSSPPPKSAESSSASSSLPILSSSSPPSSSSSPSTSSRSVSESLPEREPTPFVLHTSDMDNPNKITFYTETNSDGYYEDKCDQYIFYDDPTVHGEWEVVGMIYKDDLYDWAAGRIFMYETDSCWLGDLSINADGTARNAHQRAPHWTNGYLIIPGSGQSIARMFTLTAADGCEYLLVENKNGDYERKLVVDSYLIYARKGGFS